MAKMEQREGRTQNKEGSAELCSVEWKVELINDALEYLGEEIFKQSFESTAWFFLAS